MTPDPTYREIHATRPDLVLPVVEHATPATAPSCPETCQRHDVESDLWCLRCQARMARLVAHEWRFRAGHFFSTLWFEGRPAPDPTPAPSRCPRCEAWLTRRRPR